MDILEALSTYLTLIIDPFFDYSTSVRFTLNSRDLPKISALRPNFCLSQPLRLMALLIQQRLP
jgi:hypothetical protein